MSLQFVSSFYKFCFSIKSLPSLNVKRVVMYESKKGKLWRFFFIIIKFYEVINCYYTNIFMSEFSITKDSGQVGKFFTYFIKLKYILFLTQLIKYVMFKKYI